MDLGIYTFAEVTPDPATDKVVSARQRLMDLMKKYLTPHILSVQQQQILGALLYHSMLVPKDAIKNAQVCLLF